MQYFVFLFAVIIGTAPFSYAEESSTPQPVAEPTTIIEDHNEKVEALSEEDTLKALEADYYASIKEQDFTPEVRLQALDKITTHMSSLSATLEENARFGTLEIRLQKCWKAPPEEEPESKALLKIIEHIPEEDPKTVFHGWMFASNPALSVLEHPVYDINVIECIHNAPTTTNIEPTEGNEESSPEPPVATTPDT